MNPIFKCDVCGRPAKHHQTWFESQIVVEQHLCGLHARAESLQGIKDVLLTRIEQMPKNWFVSKGSDIERRRQLMETANLREIARMFSVSEIVKDFPHQPPPQD